MLRPHYIPSDKELQALDISREEYEEGKEKGELKNIELENERVESVIKNKGYLLYIEGTNHYNYTDLQLVSPLTGFIGITGEISGERSAYIINQYILDFFDKHLKGLEGSLLEGPCGEYPEVKFASSLFRF